MANVNNNSPKGKFGYYIFFIFLILSLAFLILEPSNGGEESISYSEFLTKVTEKNITEVYITDNQEISGSHRAGSHYKGTYRYSG